MSAGAAAHGILAAIRAIRQLPDFGRNGGSDVRCVELLTTALDDVAKVYQVNTQLQKDVGGLTRQSVADAREITRLTQANDGLNDQLHALHTEQQRLRIAI